MRKPIYELETLVKAGASYRSLVDSASTFEQSDFYRNLEVQTYDLYTAYLNALTSGNGQYFIDLGIPVRFLSEYVGTISNNYNQPVIDEFLRSVYALDVNSVNEELRIKYREIKNNPLFKRIMGQKAESLLPELRKLLGEELNIDALGVDTDELIESSERIENKLEQLRNNNTIDDDLYEYYSLNVDYLVDYYSSIRNGQQKQFEQKFSISSVLNNPSGKKR